VIATLPLRSHPPIVYPAAAVSGRSGDGATDFLEFLRGPEARAAFERHGFSLLVD
jgi:molybdate transport system substrate-binding protein